MIGTHVQSVHRAIRKLLKMGILLGDLKAGVHRSFQLNPGFGWKDSAKEHNATLKRVKQ